MQPKTYLISIKYLQLSIAANSSNFFAINSSFDGVNEMASELNNLA
jgi:hypothetical protein